MTQLGVDEKGRLGQTPKWWESKLELLLQGMLKEKQRARRWRIFFRLFLLCAVIAVWLNFSGLWPESIAGHTASTHRRHTAIVRVEGAIGGDGGVSSENIIQGLRHAFDSTHSAGVVLRLDSPGGSPVEASLVYDEVKRLRALHPEKHLYAVAEGTCASAAYYIAAAAEKIFVNRNSLIGSIGVKMDMFGLDKVFKVVGVERRLMTAGSRKGILDMFSPFPAQDKAYVQSVLDAMHQDFIKAVKSGRGDRLKGSPDELFSGLFWLGERGVALGLADALGSVGSVAREQIEAEDIVDYSMQPDLLAELMHKFNVSLAAAFKGTAQRLLDLSNTNIPEVL